MNKNKKVVPGTANKYPWAKKEEVPLDISIMDFYDDPVPDKDYLRELGISAKLGEDE